MKARLKIVLFAVVVAISCQEKEKPPVIEDMPEEQQFSNENPPVIMLLKPEYEAEIQQWDKFKMLETEIRRFQNTTADEYDAIVEEMLQLQQALSTADFPEKFDIAPVKSRISVLRTYLLQTRSLLDRTPLRNEALSTQHTEIINAFNAIKKQLAETLTGAIAEELLKNIEQEVLPETTEQ